MFDSNSSKQVVAVPVGQSSTHTFFDKWMGAAAESFRVREGGARLRLATGTSRVKGMDRDGLPLCLLSRGRENSILSDFYFRQPENK
jgi:hypothetical protein